MHRFTCLVYSIIWHFYGFSYSGPEVNNDSKKSDIIFIHFQKVNFIFFILNLSGKIVYYRKLIIQNNNRDLLLNLCTDVGYFIIYYHRFCIFIGLWSNNSRYKLFF